MIAQYFGEIKIDLSCFRNFDSSILNKSNNLLYLPNSIYKKAEKNRFNYFKIQEYNNKLTCSSLMNIVLLLILCMPRVWF